VIEFNIEARVSTFQYSNRNRSALSHTVTEQQKIYHNHTHHVFLWFSTVSTQRRHDMYDVM